MTYIFFAETSTTYLRGKTSGFVIGSVKATQVSLHPIIERMCMLIKQTLFNYTTPLMLAAPTFGRAPTSEFLVPGLLTDH